MEGSLDLDGKEIPYIAFSNEELDAAEQDLGYVNCKCGQRHDIEYPEKGPLGIYRCPKKNQAYVYSINHKVLP